MKNQYGITILVSEYYLLECLLYIILKNFLDDPVLPESSIATASSGVPAVLVEASDFECSLCMRYDCIYLILLIG